MAVVSYTVNTDVKGVASVVWSDVSTGDTPNAFAVTGQHALAFAVQFAGTYNGGTVAKLQVSNDGTNYVDVKDLYGATISGTAAGMFEGSTSALYIKPDVASGSSDAVDVTLVLRGV